MNAVLEMAHRVRPMVREDLPRIHEIELASYEHPWSLGSFSDSLNAGYSMWVREAAAGESHLLNLTIAPAWRRHGLGRDLLAHCLACACDHKADSMFLEVRISNTAAIGLYHNSGFVDLAVRRAYYPAHEGREDALIMKRELSC
jgi:ribosomal-protein-alanine N-acetyltransferase